MKHFGLCVCLLFGVAIPGMAGTLTLLSGEQLTFTSEKEFVAILLEEFLPPDFAGDTGFFLIADASEEKTRLRQLLAHTEEMTLSEATPTRIYPSLGILLQTAEYTEMGEEAGYEYVFAVKIALEDLDMIAAYWLPAPSKPQTSRDVTPEQIPTVIIDATGEGRFEVLEE